MSGTELDLASTSLTVRDTFALAALPVVFAAAPVSGVGPSEVCEWGAKGAYEIADAMLKAREGLI